MPQPSRERLIKRTWAYYNSAYPARKILADLLQRPDIKASRAVSLPFRFEIVDYAEKLPEAPDPISGYAIYRFEKDRLADFQGGPWVATEYRVVCDGIVLEKEIVPRDNRRH